MASNWHNAFVAGMILINLTIGSRCHDGALIAAQEPKKARLSAAMLSKLIGKDRASPEYRAIRGALMEAPLELDPYEEWPSKGIVLRFDGTIVDRIYLHDGKSPSLGHGRYNQELPEGLQFDDTPEVAKKKMGIPDVIQNGNDDIGERYFYYKRGIVIDFDKKGGNARCVALFQPEKNNVITPAQLRALVGKDHRSKEMAQIRMALGNQPRAYYPDGDRGFLHCWDSKGIHILFGDKNEVESILLFSHLANQEQPRPAYPFTLPERLSFKDSVDDVKKKLGMPRDTIGTTDDLPLWLAYRAKGIDVGFDRRGGRVVIVEIRIYASSQEK